MSALADVMGVIAAVSVAVLLYTGSLVTRRTRDTIEAERNNWRALHDHNHYVATLVAATETHADHEVVPVETGGEVVAHLCVTCDKQLGAGWTR